MMYGGARLAALMVDIYGKKVEKLGKNTDPNCCKCGDYATCGEA
jgi:hypothetical protein